MPPVTSPPPRPPKPAAEDRAANAVRTAHANNRTRPFKLAADGFPAPTALEIEEGAAHKLMTDRPKSRILAEEWTAIHWELCNLEGFPATTRCDVCHVVRFGRAAPVPCGHCGGLERWVPVIKRLGT